MPDIQIPLEVPELKLKPEQSGKVKLSEDMQMSLALLAAYYNGKIRLVKSSESGALSITSPRTADIVQVTSTGPNETNVGSDIPCSEVLVYAHPDNVGRCWVRPDKTASAVNAWPLDAGDGVPFTLDNLKQLNMLTVTTGDTLIIKYSR